MSGCSAVIRRTHKDNFYAYGYRKMWKTLAPGRGDRGTLPGAAADGRQRDLWREAAWEAVAHHDPRPSAHRSARTWSTATSPL